MPAKSATTCSSIGHGEYCGWFSVATMRSPRASAACVALSSSEPNCANASSSRYCARSRRRRPATFFIAFVCAREPTRETEVPTLTAGRTPEKKRSDWRKICPSVIEMTFVGMYAAMSPACVSMIGSAVSEPPPSSSESFAARSSSREWR